ncbi:helix-turn-helix transcriptional regulator [Diaphorobacter sp. HDW4B]|uniref:helix-turn-helix domain-containing protein n=1 Tax=Diaphorobacter sp. HDW4B TaxID=2714925 RepID=UPI0014092C20|nr:helix-turn-helix transcriptional regulator [Diaphorobacter sp. HDW4B]QIL73281.1 helix-turn-helix transcriptional regulator [Diaphorobacter sp. HDW4B]
MTQRTLSELTSISVVQLSRYESGKSTPRPRVLKKLAYVLGVDAAWLIEGAALISPKKSAPKPGELAVVAERQPDGGSEIVIEMGKDISELLRSAALASGMSMNDYLKNAILTQACAQISAVAAPPVVDINELAAKVKKLLEADGVKANPKLLKEPAPLSKNNTKSR